MSQFELGIVGDYFVPVTECSTAGAVAASDRLGLTRNTFMGVSGGKIVTIEPFTEVLRSRCQKFIDASRSKVVLPGLVNTHTHLAMSLFRGLHDDLPFSEWLFQNILPLESRVVDEAFVRLGTRLSLYECVRFGTTTVNDMYFYADAAAEEVSRAGLRGLISQVVLSAQSPECRVLGSDKKRLLERLVDRWKGSETVRVGVAPHAPYTCSDETLSWVAAEAKRLQLSVHTHLSETQFEVDQSIKQHGLTPVQRFQRLGIFDSPVIAAHSIYLTDADIRIMVASGASVSHCPDSNLKLSSGVAPVAQYLASRLRVGLGTDGAASNNSLNLFGAMNLGVKLQKWVGGSNTAMVASQVLRMATIDGARALGWDSKTGSLEVGKNADFIVVDLDYPHLQPVNDVISHLVYSTTGLEVETTVCGGVVLMRDGEFCGSGLSGEDFENVRDQVASLAGGF